MTTTVKITKKKSVIPAIRLERRTTGTKECKIELSGPSLSTDVTVLSGHFFINVITAGDLGENRTNSFELKEWQLFVR